MMMLFLETSLDFSEADWRNAFLFSVAALASSFYLAACASLRG